VRPSERGGEREREPRAKEPSVNAGASTRGVFDAEGRRVGEREGGLAGWCEGGRGGIDYSWEVSETHAPIEAAKMCASEPRRRELRIRRVARLPWAVGPRTQKAEKKRGIKVERRATGGQCRRNAINYISLRIIENAALRHWGENRRRSPVAGPLLPRATHPKWRVSLVNLCGAFDGSAARRSISSHSDINNGTACIRRVSLPPSPTLAVRRSQFVFPPLDVSPPARHLTFRFLRRLSSRSRSPGVREMRSAFVGPPDNGS
jgi:hypothetical protein